MKAHPNYHLQLIPAAGQFAFYSHFESICAQFSTNSISRPQKSFAHHQN
jgi:hypothetical protein